MNSSCDKVFIVDDDSAVCDTLSTVFTSAGYWTSAFTDARSFLRVARIELPTCVLLKLGMPIISGFDMLRELDAGKYAARFLSSQAMTISPA
jgi:FixJ family two-component response regulator